VSKALLLNMNARAAHAFIRRHGIVFKCATEQFLQSHGGIVDQQWRRELAPRDK